MAQYVYSLNRVGKIVPPKRQILKDISCRFFPGAKIGLLGLNGSGKSSLIRIMAGVDKDIEGEAIRCRASASAICRRKPQLDPTHTVRQAVEAGLGEIVSAKVRLDEIYAAYAEPDADFDKLAEEQAKCEAILATAGAISTRRWKSPPTPCACRRGTQRSATCRAARSAASRCASCCCPARHAAARRATNHLDAESVDWLNSSWCATPVPWWR